MRVVFVLWPNRSHVFPALPLANAMQAAGHEVCIASHPDLTEAITATGQTAVAIGDRDTMPALTLENLIAAEPSESWRARLAAALDVDPTDAHWEFYSTYHVTAVNIFHSPEATAADPSPGVDELVGFIRRWGPDLVIWDAPYPAAAVAARACGAASARLLLDPDYQGWVAQRAVERAPELAAAGLTEPVVAAVTPVAERYGVQLDDDLLHGDWTIDAMPPALRPETDRRMLPMRWVAYSGAGVLPEWLFDPPTRPRVALSLGMATRELISDADLVAKLLSVVAELDIEVVATLDDRQTAGQQIPDNVRTVDFLPLTQLLPSCSAILHHGGGGTFWAALSHRVPQLLPSAGVGRMGGAIDYADYIANNHAGMVIDPETESVEILRKQLSAVLSDPGYQAGADRLYAEWLTRPSPADLVPTIERLVQQVTRGGRPAACRR